MRKLTKADAHEFPGPLPLMLRIMERLTGLRIGSGDQKIRVLNIYRPALSTSDSFLEKDCIGFNQHSIYILRMIHGGRGGCVRENGETQIPAVFSHVPHLPAPPRTQTGMSTDQRASERIGELIHDAFESLLQVNTNLERLQDLIGLGMDLGRLLAPHSQATWKFMVPQEQRFRENWNKFISATEGAESSVSRPQRAPAETVEPAPAPSPVITAQATAEEALPETQSKV